MGTRSNSEPSKGQVQNEETEEFGIGLVDTESGDCNDEVCLSGHHAPMRLFEKICNHEPSYAHSPVESKVNSLHEFTTGNIHTPVSEECISIMKKLLLKNVNNRLSAMSEIEAMPCLQNSMEEYAIKHKDFM